VPVRLFHWLTVLLIAFSWWSAENGETSWHMWSGYAVLFLLSFRILWGFLGSSTARFASFVRGPRGVRDYLGRAKDWRGTGHTPLGALSVVALLALIASQLGFGLVLVDEDGVCAGPLNHLVSFDTGEWAHEVHELLFNVLLAFIALHVAAIDYYRVIRGKRLLGPMIRGSSSDLPAGTDAMVPAPASRLVICLVIAAAFTTWIIAGAPPF
jgi:cytochrome b